MTKYECIELIRLAYLAGINDTKEECEQWCNQGSRERAEEILQDAEDSGDLTETFVDEHKSTPDSLALISEIACGYREAGIAQIIQAIARYKNKARKHDENKKVESLFEKIDELTEIREQIAEDC